MSPVFRIPKDLTMKTTLIRAGKSYQVLPPTGDYTFKNSSPKIHNVSIPGGQISKMLVFLLPTRFPFPLFTFQNRFWHQLTQVLYTVMMMGLFPVTISRNYFLMAFSSPA